MAALGVSLLLGCGGGDSSDSPAVGGQETAAPVEEAVSDVMQAGGGDSADVEKFLEDYEELIDKYCDFTDRFSKASMSEMAELAQEMATQGAELAEYSMQAIAFQAAYSPEAEEKLEELEKKAEACGEEIGG